MIEVPLHRMEEHTRVPVPLKYQLPIHLLLKGNGKGQEGSCLWLKVLSFQESQRKTDSSARSTFLLTHVQSNLPVQLMVSCIPRHYFVTHIPHSELSGARRPAGERRAPPLLHVGEACPPDYTSTSPSNSPLSAPIPTFPPPPHPLAPPLSSSPTRAATNALSRALSIASRKLFGTISKSPSSPSAVPYSPSSPRRPQLILRSPSERETEIDPMEDGLLANLEELAQKTDFLTHWADEMYEYVKAVPQSMYHSYSSMPKLTILQNHCPIQQSFCDVKASQRDMRSAGETPTKKPNTTLLRALQSTCSSCLSRRKGSTSCGTSKSIYECAILMVNSR